MESSKLAVKFFVRDPAAVDTRAFIPLFHQWIQTHAVVDHMLIDVADYRHVECGPGTVLVAHEANFSTDTAGGKLGLLYARKQPIAGNFGERLKASNVRPSVGVMDGDHDAIYDRHGSCPASTE